MFSWRTKKITAEDALKRIHRQLSNKYTIKVLADMQYDVRNDKAFVSKYGFRHFEQEDEPNSVMFCLNLPIKYEDAVAIEWCETKADLASFLVHPEMGTRSAAKARYTELKDAAPKEVAPHRKIDPFEEKH